VTALGENVALRRAAHRGRHTLRFGRPHPWITFATQDQRRTVHRRRVVERLERERIETALQAAPEQK